MSQSELIRKEREIARLREQLALAEETAAHRLDVIKELTGSQLPEQIAAAFSIRGAEARILAILMSGRIVPRHQLCTALYHDRDADDWPGEKTVEVQICRLRKALKPHGILIVTHWGIGLQLEPWAVNAITAKLEAAKQ